MAHEDIIDSHIHLYPQSEVATLAWCKDEHPLNGQYSIEQYLSARRDSSKIGGFIFIETDRTNHLDSDKGWEYPLAEVDWISRVAAGTPKPGEGHTAEHAQLCLAIIPWAPIPLGSEHLCKYVEQVKARAGSSGKLIKGFRYLVQDKREGTMTQPGFIDSLRWLGEHGYTFDLGVDQRSGGDWQLSEAVDMIREAHDGVEEEKKVTIVISKGYSSNFMSQSNNVDLDHMCKPNMRMKEQHDQPTGSPTDTRTFAIWAKRISELASLSKTYMKISGNLSEIYPLPRQQDSQDFWVRAEMMRRIYSWVLVWMDQVLVEFGPSRIMFGSDWPVCNVGGGGNGVAWKNVSFGASPCTSGSRTTF